MNEIDDPMALFQEWYEGAVATGIGRPDAIALATASTTGAPSVRMVLFKGVQHAGFVFFTNYESKKGRELDENPQAALAFYWEALHRQVRVEGRVEKTGPDESNEYWSTRPRESQLSAIASLQSSPIGSRMELEASVTRLRAEFENREIPRPARWGGYRVIPDRIEFWQGQPNRLHDRLNYIRDGRGWRVERLAP